jgi:hypothetical protein
MIVLAGKFNYKVLLTRSDSRETPSGVTDSLVCHAGLPGKGRHPSALSDAVILRRNVWGESLIRSGG